MLDELPGRAEREPVVGAGEGGDETTAIDAAAELAILPHFAGHRIVSEEVGISGEGRYTVSFSHYEPAPAGVQNALRSQHKPAEVD